MTETVRANNIRLHGNGYIQYDLPGWVRSGGLQAALRLNVWVSGLPQQEVPTPIHSHTYSYHSDVLMGVLRHNPFRLKEGDGYSIYRGTSDARGIDRRLWTGDATDADQGESEYYQAGQGYDFSAGAFHTAEPLVMPCVTVVRKVAVGVAHGPFILCPADTISREDEITSKALPDWNRRQLPPDELWAVLLSVLNGSGLYIPGSKVQLTSRYRGIEWGSI